MTQPENFSGTPKENLRASRILCISLITGSFLFAIMVIIVNQFSGPFMEETNQYSNIFLLVLAIISSICIFKAIQQYSKGITLAKSLDNSLNDKLNQYRASLIIYMALCEGPALFSVVIFLLLGNFFLLIFTAIILVVMLRKYPTVKKAISELELNWQEQEQLK